MFKDIQISINTNKNVYVKLTDHGKKIVREYKENLLDMIKERKPTEQFLDEMTSHIYSQFTPNDEGFSRFLLWELFSIFGPHISMSCEVPFEDNLIHFIDGDIRS